MKVFRHSNGNQKVNGTEHLKKKTFGAFKLIKRKSQHDIF